MPRNAFLRVAGLVYVAAAAPSVGHFEVEDEDEQSERRAAFAARSPVMASAKVFRTPLTVAAWQTKPSWAIVAADDKIINPEVEKMWYARARSRTTILPGVGHDVYEARPAEVAAVIKDAAQHAAP